MHLTYSRQVFASGLNAQTQEFRYRTFLSAFNIKLIILIAIINSAINIIAINKYIFIILTFVLLFNKDKIILIKIEYV